MSVNEFTVGQRVAVFRDHGREFEGIGAVEKVTHRGTRVFVAGFVGCFDRAGWFGGRRIVLATAEHEEIAERMKLLGIVDERLGTFAGHSERKERHGRIPTKTLRDVAALLLLVGGKEEGS